MEALVAAGNGDPMRCLGRLRRSRRHTRFNYTRAPIRTSRFEVRLFEIYIQASRAEIAKTHDNPTTFATASLACSVLDPTVR